MASLDRGVVRLTGFPGGDGFSTFYATPGGSFMSALRTFWAAMAPSMGQGITISFPSSGDTIDDTTGHLTGSWSGSTLTDVTTPATAKYASGVGVAINWLSSAIVPIGSSSKTAHRLRGRTFVVPVTAAAYDGDGTLLSSYLTPIQAGADALVIAGATFFKVWHRPAVGASDGMSGQVNAAKIHDRVAFLSSRRP
jgi:hypothetical protein